MASVLFRLMPSLWKIQLNAPKALNLATSSIFLKTRKVSIIYENIRLWDCRFMPLSATVSLFPFELHLNDCRFLATDL